MAESDQLQADSTLDRRLASISCMLAASPVTIHNEQVKLLAASQERAGTSAITIGVFAPLAAALFKIEGINQALLPTIMGVVCWALLAAVLYIESQRTLRRLAQ